MRAVTGGSNPPFVNDTHGVILVNDTHGVILVNDTVDGTLGVRWQDVGSAQFDRRMGLVSSAFHPDFGLGPIALGRRAY